MIEVERQSSLALNAPHDDRHAIAQRSRRVRGHDGHRLEDEHRIDVLTREAGRDCRSIVAAAHARDEGDIDGVGEPRHRRAGELIQLLADVVVDGRLPEVGVRDDDGDCRPTRTGLSTTRVGGDGQFRERIWLGIDSGIVMAGERDAQTIERLRQAATSQAPASQ